MLDLEVRGRKNELVMKYLSVDIKEALKIINDSKDRKVRVIVTPHKFYALDLLRESFFNQRAKG